MLSIFRPAFKADQLATYLEYAALALRERLPEFAGKACDGDVWLAYHFAAAGISWRGVMLLEGDSDTERVLFASAISLARITYLPIPAPKGLDPDECFRIGKDALLTYGNAAMAANAYNDAMAERWRWGVSRFIFSSTLDALMEHVQLGLKKRRAIFH